MVECCGRVPVWIVGKNCVCSGAGVAMGLRSRERAVSSLCRHVVVADAQAPRAKPSNSRRRDDVVPLRQQPRRSALLMAALTNPCMCFLSPPGVE